MKIQFVRIKAGTPLREQAYLVFDWSREEEVSHALLDWQEDWFICLFGRTTTHTNSKDEGTSTI